ncbi:recombinase family protein [Alteromonas stellipolaris]|uniref:recombinase family protein n=1 Tax=Alteromonas stellipolaris TaxID=233316 RepID=UPI00211829C1|nr:recombinase family protein [Alteromonas stellipolaris]MCQ8849809.1 recombinase family protein [Alteromonas stellipolaris]
MKARIYLRASTKEQDSKRAESALLEFANSKNLEVIETYCENYSGTKLERPQLNRLLQGSQQGEILLVESVDRLSRLSQEDFDTLKLRLSEKRLKLVVMDLPTTYEHFSEGITGSIMAVINNMLIDLMATMARLDQEKRVERIKQGMEKAKAQGKRVGGRAKNQELRANIKKYLAKGMTAEEVAKLVDCGVATVYRVKRE